MKYIFIFVMLFFSINVYSRGRIREREETDIYIKYTAIRYMVPYSLKDLTANTIQYMYWQDYSKYCQADFYVPYYATSSTYFTVDNYRDENLTRGFDNRSLNIFDVKNLYGAIKRGDKVEIETLLHKIYKDINYDTSNYILYGKDKTGRNVGYIYNYGHEDKGIVFFYPDEFEGILSGIWKSPTRLGTDQVFKNFLNTMIEYNPHLSFYSVRYNSQEAIRVKYKK